MTNASRGYQAPYFSFFFSWHLASLGISYFNKPANLKLTKITFQWQQHIKLGNKKFNTSFSSGKYRVNEVLSTSPIVRLKSLDVICKINKGRLLKKVDSLRIPGVKVKYSHENGGWGRGIVSYTFLIAEEAHSQSSNWCQQKNSPKKSLLFLAKQNTIKVAA